VKANMISPSLLANINVAHLAQKLIRRNILMIELNRVMSHVLDSNNILFD